MSVLPPDDSPRAAEPRRSAVGSDNPTTELPRPGQAPTGERSTDEPTGEDLDALGAHPASTGDTTEPPWLDVGVPSAAAASPMQPASAPVGPAVPAPRLQELAYRTAGVAALTCALENERRLQEAEERATRLRAEAEEGVARLRAEAEAAAALALREAHDENARQLGKVRRLVDALNRELGVEGQAADPATAVGRTLPVAAPAAAGGLVVPLQHSGEAIPWTAEQTLSWSPEETLSYAPEAVPEETGVSSMSLAPPGAVELVVGPFRRFSQLALFTQALGALPGMQSVATRQFIKGTVHFHVAYMDPLPLVNRLVQMPEFQCEVIGSSPTRVELLVGVEDPTEDILSAGGISV